MSSKPKINVLDLFSGIGGFSLGLERTRGFKTIAFAESDNYCRKILRKHWPQAEIFYDVKEVNSRNWPLIDMDIDLVCGGFPCQDISYAGKGQGLKGERSGLWSEFYRIIGEVGPAWVIIENVPALRSRGLVTILQNLSEIGYDAEWHCIPASYLGAPHKRDRVWIVGYPSGYLKQPLLDESCFESSENFAPKGKVHDSFTDSDTNVPNPFIKRLEGLTGYGKTIWKEKEIRSLTEESLSLREYAASWWLFEPSVDRVVDGVSNRMDRMKCLGNSVVPQIVEIIGYGILNHETQKKSTQPYRTST